MTGFARAAALLAVMQCTMPSAAQEVNKLVPADHWSYTVAEELREHGLIIGLPGATFRTKKRLTRGDFAGILQRFAGRILPTAEEIGKGGPSGSSRSDWQAIHRLIAEYGDEMLAQGTSKQDLRRLKRYLIRQEFITASPPKLDQKALFRDIPHQEPIYTSMALLQSSGLLVGYPEFYFHSKRTLTPYEFAVAIDRALTRAYPLGVPSTQWPAMKPGAQPLLSSLITDYYSEILGFCMDDRTAFSLAEWTLRNEEDRFSDVPKGNWVYDALNKLWAAGVSSQPPHESAYGSRRTLTRYEAAVTIDRILPKLAASKLSQSDADLVRDLVAEFRRELSELGRKQSEIDAALAKLPPPSPKPQEQH